MSGWRPVSSQVWKKGVQVDMPDKLGKVQRPEGARPQEAGLGRTVFAPVDLEAVGPGDRDGRARLGLLAAGELFADADVFGAGGGLRLRPLGGRHQARHHAHGAARIRHIGGRTARVRRLDLHGGVGAAGGGSTDQQRHGKAAPLHLLGHEHHLVQRGRDQAGKADDVDFLLLRFVQDAVGGDHDAEVDHLVVVAAQDDADDVLADVVDVALDGGHQDTAGRCAGLAGLGLHEG